MLETFKTVLTYLKNPIQEKDTNKKISYRFLTLYRLFILCLFSGIILTPLFSILEYFNFVDMETHKLEALFKGMPLYKILLLGAVVAPILEEFIFRAPLTLFKSKKTFKIAFYLFTIAFGLVHITNFDITTKTILFAPILVLPQIILGGYLGFIRIRFGLLWAILLHACYNGFLMIISFTG